MSGREAAAPVARSGYRKLALVLMCGTMLGGIASPAFAQDAGTDAAAQAGSDGQTVASAPAAAPAPQANVIRQINVVGAERLEPSTIISYIRLRVGQVYTAAAADQALKDLAATELFSDYSIQNNDGIVTITVTENPIINRVILEGNKRLKDDKITKEIKLSPRQIFTRSKVRADVARIIELYKRQGRFAATVDPQMVKLSQNRVDVIFDIHEGPKSKVRQINIIGNHAFSAGELRGQMLTKQARFSRIFSSRTTYDPDRLAFDQQKLRQFYLTNGYADFRVVSAVAELTPDKKDFIITYVVEEGKRYKFGKVNVDSQIRDFDSKLMTKNLPMHSGDWYNAKQVEDTVDNLTDLAGTFGYAFADVQPQFRRNPDDLTMDVTFNIREAPRVYVERVDVNGNTLTQDKVVRREFRLAEGDAFNSLAVKRSTNRIKSLGYFQENFEVNQKQGSAPDKILLEANVEEQPTGQLQLSAGFSSIEKFILAASVQQRNFRGRGQTVGIGVNWSSYSRSVNLSFTEPYVFDRNISAGVSIYRRDINSFNYNRSNTTFSQSTTGASLRVGVPLTEYMSLIGSYTFNLDDVTLDPNQYYSDRQNPPNFECDPLLAGRYLCEALGRRTSSIVGATLAYNNLDSTYHPTMGTLASLTGEFSGVGGSVRYMRVSGKVARYWPIGKGFVFSLRGEGGAIRGLNNGGFVNLTDRYFLGEPQLRGFDIRGVGPRVLREPIISDGNGGTTVITDRNQVGDESLGGNAYYIGHAELEIPLGSGGKEMGLRPSIFLDVGSLWHVGRPVLNSSPYPNGINFPQRDANGNPLYTQTVTNTDGTTTTTIVTSATAPDGSANTALTSNIAPFQEVFLGDSASPRVAVGIGVNWNSPFGPLRLDFAKVLRKVPGDRVKEFSFNVGTQF
ncbi:outer membrane protein assembly factor BamA [Tsuneonella mangrovi]|uniref:outer membrane protein assembly factor BamA n=1 Tax=Tsuneonella mangrovi TaxID=1982042 RepID=UPI000BA1DBB0|nr:outer membrane protein assembly factor BamA [Tsuneonella mangrovi]